MNDDLNLQSYDYHLPTELIAQRPCNPRDESKLLIYHQARNEVVHTTFKEVATYLPQDSLLVMNQSAVYPCRLFCHKSTGGQAEIFFLNLPDRKGWRPSLIHTTSKKKIGDQFIVNDKVTLTLMDKDEQGRFWLEIVGTDYETLLHDFGSVPLPPYIREGRSDSRDKDDYQTTFAREVGSVAAPTAGLHFTPRVFDRLDKKQIRHAFVTLHVGLGTFAPVKTATITDHHMHTENYTFDDESLKKIKQAKGNIIAVGTTSLRALESSWDKVTQPHKIYETDIFLFPGKSINSAKGLLTNFHLPKSSLIMLVSALIGRKKTLELYAQAIAKEYRFFSYGDAMLILTGET